MHAAEQEPESSPECDYQPRFSDANRWISFSHVDPTSIIAKTDYCYGCCCGFLFGGAIAAIAYVISDATNRALIGDIIVASFFCLSCILPIFTYCDMIYFKPMGKNVFVVDILEATPKFFGAFTGIGSIVSLIVIHLSLRFTVYDDINTAEEQDPIVWIILIGTIIMLVEMLLFCYFDFKKQGYYDFDDDHTTQLYDEKDYYS